MCRRSGIRNGQGRTNLLLLRLLLSPLLLNPALHVLELPLLMNWLMGSFLPKTLPRVLLFFFSFRFSILSSSDININNCVLFFVSALVAKISISERLPILLFRIVYRVAHLVVLPLPLLLISSISLWVSFLTFQFAIL